MMQERTGLAAGGSARRVYSVSEFSGEVRRLLEASYPELWIEGEISNLSNPRSGHSYFSLKDADSQIRCALFKQRKLRCAVQPAEGANVLLRARVSLYQARGDFQLIVDYMEDAGEGALRRAFEQLKRQLQAEGLFAEENKRALPPHPARIGIITSATGAALRDVLTTLARNAPWIPVVIYPTLVQGEQAPRAIVNALDTACRRAECDVLLLIRGGGSLEDLQAFNDEAVARAVAGSSLPLISGVGHETDTTIADYVADARAATPTAAAQLATAEAGRLRERVWQNREALKRATDYRLIASMQRLDHLAARIRHPAERIRFQLDRLEHLDLRLRRAAELQLQRRERSLESSVSRLAAQAPGIRIERHSFQLDYHHERLCRSMDNRLLSLAQRLDGAHKQLEYLDPAHVLARGYSVLMHTEDRRVVASVKDAQPGDPLTARLGDGELGVTVTEVK